LFVPVDSTKSREEANHQTLPRLGSSTVNSLLLAEPANAKSKLNLSSTLSDSCRADQTEEPSTFLDA
jgi:hypothetical protein